ncbi:MAG: hypothetical protein ABSB29_01125 [Nitrososphaerales archaeon]
MKLSTARKVSDSDDSRGDIFELGDCGNVHINVLTTRKGHIRGGHYHDYNEEFFVVSGKFEFHSGFEGVDDITIRGANETIVTIPGVPHYVKALEDSVMIEFRPCGTKYKPIDYEPFRKLARARP